MIPDRGKAQAANGRPCGVSLWRGAGRRAGSGGLALWLGALAGAVTLACVAAPRAGAAADQAAGRAGEGGAPLILCTAPWPPFVETVPPPLPPEVKPVPVQVRPPGRDHAQDAETAATGDLGAETSKVVATAAGPGAVLPPGVEVLPPMPPRVKQAGRIAWANAAARRRAEASVRPLPAPAVAPASEEVASEAAADASVTVAERPTLETLSMPTARALLPQGQPGGPMTEAVRAACRAADLTCRIVLVPWLRPRDHLETGPCDGLFPIEDTVENRRYMRVSQPLIESHLAFFTMNTRIHRVSELTEYIVLAQGPSAAARQAKTVVEGLDDSALVLGPDMGSLIRRLSGLEPRDRVALYGNYHEVTRAMSEVDEPIPALNVVRHRSQALRVGFALNRVPGPVLRAFDSGVDLIERSRVLQEILDTGGLLSVN